MAVDRPARLPATFFLQDAVDRGLGAIAARLDPAEAGRPFFWLALRPTPRLEHQIWDLGDMCARYVDAFLLGRQVTGTTAHAGAEAALLRLLPACDPFANPFMAGRMLLAYVDRYLQEPCAERRRPVDNLVAQIRARLTFEESYAYWFRQAPGWRSQEQPLGDFTPYPAYPLGGIILALARYGQAIDDPECEDLLERLCRFVLHASGTFAEDGSYRGHTHSGGILTALAGILRWAIRRGDAGTVAWMRRAFDWTLRHSSTWGWVPDGLGQEPGSCETCAVVDALHAGILLGRHADPAYFETVECFAGNQLLENQILRPEWALPPGEIPDRDRIAKALYGSWASWSLPSSLDNGLDGVEGCCVGAGIRGCCLVWDAAIEKRGGAVYVHMGFSRRSPWVDVVGHEPFEGRLELRLRQAAPLRVRVPSWVARDDLSVAINGCRLEAPARDGAYLSLAGLRAGDAVSITYPLRCEERPEVVAGHEYRTRWRGHTVMAIAPAGQRYPLYQRSHLERTPAPLAPVPACWSQTGGPVHW